MITYKCSILVIIKNVIYSLFGGVAAWLVASCFLEFNTAVMIGVGLCVIMLYFTLFGDRIKITVDDDILAVYRHGKIKHQFNLKEVGLHANVRTSQGDSDCMLTITESNGDETSVDCSLLGASRFYKLLHTLKVTDPAPVVVETIKAEAVGEE
ncbi:MAG: hypothetical protein LBL34_00120 [Clostridiales bacterium]|jgi:hypothetical protein|nr:hypothetical protein [Clostridiales bacterium]